MSNTAKALYKDGVIELVEPAPPATTPTEVLVVFPSTAKIVLKWRGLFSGADIDYEAADRDLLEPRQASEAHLIAESETSDG